MRLSNLSPKVELPFNERMAIRRDNLLGPPKSRGNPELAALDSAGIMRRRRIRLWDKLNTRGVLIDPHGTCAICGHHPGPDDRTLAVDHSHSAGHVRGMLCGPCNTALGMMRDNPELLRLAAAYLERTS